MDYLERVAAQDVDPLAAQVPEWAALTLALAVAVWSLALGIGLQRRLIRIWFRPGARALPTAGRVLLLHLVFVAAGLAGSALVLQLREATTHASLVCCAGLLLAVVPLGPFVISVVPTTTGPNPDREDLVAAGATLAQARVVRGLGAPFALVEMMILIALGFAALAA